MSQKNKNPKPNERKTENFAEENAPSTSGIQNVEPTKENEPAAGIENINLSLEHDHQVNLSSEEEFVNEVTPVESISFEKEFRDCIETFHQIEKNGKKEKYVRCKLCISLPNIVKLNSDNRKVAPITTMDGIRYRHRYVSDHFESRYHQACKKAINVPNNATGCMDLHISRADEKLAFHVTKLLFTIYVDAKKLTPSAYTWPARFVAAEAGRSFDYREVNAPAIDSGMNLQYVNQTSHASLLNVIVESDKPK